MISLSVYTKRYANLLFGLIVLFLCSCNNSVNEKASSHADSLFARDALIVTDSTSFDIPLLKTRIQKIREALSSKIPVLLLNNADSNQQKAQLLACNDPKFGENYFDENTHKPCRNEIFNVYKARPQELPANYQQGNVYRVEMYNYAVNITTIALVDIASSKVISVNKYAQTQPDITKELEDVAVQIAIHSPEVIKALGYKPGEEQAMMAATKTALNRTKCERSMHLCVAPTFEKGDKALWAIVDLTEFRLMGLRWTNVGTTGKAERISERKLVFDKIMECYCKQKKSVDKNGWKMNYVITSSDGLRVSEVYYNGKLIINNAKLVDWHVSYSGTDGFGYSDAIGCPEFSHAAVIAVSEPQIKELVENSSTVGFVLEQSFQSEQWPRPCNYNYMQRYEFYNDGRFRIAFASLGRGCGNDGTYRPVARIELASDKNNFFEWTNDQWQPWQQEQWRLQNPQTTYMNNRFQYKMTDNSGQGFYIEPGRGQFNDGGRGDNAYVFVTKLHTDIDEGESDMITIGPCCNTDYHQGPEKFIEPNPEKISGGPIVLWYVSQIKNDDAKGREYCWAESYLEDGVYKTRSFPCISGPMFIPVK